MKLEEAIQTAIDYETRVHTLYREAAEKASDERGRRAFEVLADEERGHLKYLTSRLREWQETGSINPEELKSVFPSKEVIEQGLQKLKDRMEPRTGAYDAELELLGRALNVEIETSSFYYRMVHELGEEGRRLFERFLAIEEGHQAIVQAQIDSVSGLGFWFDHTEFSLEGA